MIGSGTNVLILGGVILDHYIVARFPHRGQDTLIEREFQRVAGCALNVAVTLQNLGCRPYLVSSIGAERRGEIILTYLKSCGFEQKFINRHASSKPSGYCLVLLEADGERTFFTYRGCEDSLPPELQCMSTSGDAAAKSTDTNNKEFEFPFVYLSGYYLLNSEEDKIKLQLLANLKKRGSKIIFDPGSLVGQIATETLLLVLQLAEIALPNRKEVALLEEKLNLPKPFHSWCLAHNYLLVVEKNGSKSFYSHTKKQSMRHVPFKARAVNTSGAGDSFAAGLIFALLQNEPVQTRAVEIAAACGALTTTFGEPHGNFSLEQLKKFMQK